MYKIGQTVMIFPYWNTDISFVGTIVHDSVGGWSDRGGVYRVLTKDGQTFWCAENSMIAYEERENEREEV